MTPDIRLCVVFAEGPLPRDLTFPLRSPKRDVTIVGLTDGEILCVYHLVDGTDAPSGQVDCGGLQPAITQIDHALHGTTAKILEAARQV